MTIARGGSAGAVSERDLVPRVEDRAVLGARADNQDHARALTTRHQGPHHDGDR
jgi:hypothetical protein